MYACMLGCTYVRMYMCTCEKASNSTQFYVVWSSHPTNQQKWNVLEYHRGYKRTESHTYLVSHEQFSRNHSHEV